MQLDRPSVVLLGFWIGITCLGAADREVPDVASAPGLVQVGRTAIPFNNGGKRVPNWSGGALVVLDHGNPALPVISAYGRDGTLLPSAGFAIPEANRILVNAFKRAADGNLVVIGSAYTADSRAALFLSVISSGGQQQRIIRLNPFYPHDVAIAPNGDVWLAGEDEAPDHNVIRRYSAFGGELGAYVPRSTLVSPSYTHPAEDSFLVASRDRVGWYSNNAGEYMEFALDGRPLTRVTGLPLKAPSRVDGVGLCDDGGVFLSVYPVSLTERRSEAFTLDRVSATWKRLALGGDSLSSVYGPYRPVYGCDGNDVVIRARLPGELLGLSWFRPTDAP